MNTPGATVRPFETTDFERVCALMPPEWRFSGLSEPELDAQARMDAAGVLSVANLRLVAEDPSHPDGPLAGYLFARLEGIAAPADAPRWSAVYEDARERLLAGGDAAVRACRYEEQLADRGDLIIEAAAENRGSDNELELFVVNPQVRGRGTGTALMRAFEQALDGLGATSYWLQTDSTCTWTWYETHGFKRVADVPLTAEFPMPDSPAALADTDDGSRDSADISPESPRVFMYRKDLSA